MFRYSEVVVSCAGLGDLVLYRSGSQSRAQMFRRSMREQMIFGSTPMVREVTASYRKETGVLQKAIE